MVRSNRGAFREPKPIKPCPVCGRMVSTVADGSPRSHRKTDGTACSAGTRKGSCPVCGREVQLYLDGTVRPHKQLRIRAARPSVKDGWLDKSVVPETYNSKTDCSGAGSPAEVSDVLP